MARGRRLTIALALFVARTALAADPCEEGRLLTGLAVAAGEGGLTIAAVENESPAAAGGFRVGDHLVQANASVLTSCDEWSRAVRDARRERKALLLLVRRPDGEMPLMLAQATWTRAVAVAPPVPPPTSPVGAAPSAGTAPPPPPPPPPKPRAVEPPSVTAIVKEPPPAAGAQSAKLEEVLKALESLAPAEAATARLGTYQQQLLRVHRQIETLASRDATPPRVVTALRTVVRYYDAAEVAWEAEEAQRERERRPRHIPGIVAPYFAESDAEATIVEFPFLTSTVEREPGTGTIEISGLWRPGAARTLLWERAREELGRLTQWLGSRP